MLEDKDIQPNTTHVNKITLHVFQGYRHVQGHMLNTSRMAAYGRRRKGREEASETGGVLLWVDDGSRA